MIAQKLDREHPATSGFVPLPRNTLPPAGLFITGTDTAVGKTFVAAAIAATLRGNGHRVGTYKPVATGLIDPNRPSADSDPEVLRRAAGPNATLEDVCPQRFAEPAAPPVAAAAEGTSVDAQLLVRGARHWRNRCDLLVVEGVGGLLCPLTDDLTVADLAQAIAYPLVLVARRALGTLNHTLLTLEVARLRGLNIAALILNSTGPPSGSLAEQTNAQQLRRRCMGPLFIELPYFPPQSTPSRRHASPAQQPLCNRQKRNPPTARDLLSAHDWSALTRVG